MRISVTDMGNGVDQFAYFLARAKPSIRPALLMLVMLYTDVSMLVDMTYVYCPFMILPLYAHLVKMDVRLLEAAHDLGASARKAFWLITVPLSRSGIVAGSMLVFIPCVG